MLDFNENDGKYEALIQTFMKSHDVGYISNTQVL